MLFVETPIGVSQWKAQGKRYGYWDSFVKQEREKIKKDLLKIADKGEYEDLRREVEAYFK